MSLHISSAFDSGNIEVLRVDRADRIELAGQQMAAETVPKNEGTFQVNRRPGR